MDQVIIFSAKYLFLLSVLLFLYFFLKLEKKRKKGFIIFSFITFTISYLSAKIAGYFIYDPRPFVVEHVKPLIAHAADNGFPSDHMLLTMTIAAIVFSYNKKFGILLAFVAILVGSARVLAVVHHIEDIVGSTIIAILATYIVYLLLPFISKKHKKI